ncbi:DNA-binding transcriptional regulator, AcrR family [Paenibacillus catalpae]|uniref:DNA-binding transcriptional regulator, AcrR family n=1 Tax=Paenibacillus catalpae TaxID=1045775 RepID=A0A1I1YXH6_9BACL|nr:TetR/AcrR family transcriptional regulator [Paenibacillus catalpae]SFE24002.1 DNA-binding transcriptional regulator, AcrR family [Paenibacillus catalpae]
MADKKKDSQEVSKLILQAARSLFAEHGVEAVSMHQIAKSIQIGQGTLYRRYANKSDLCMDLMNDTFDSLMEEIDQLLDSKKELPVKDRLTSVVRRVLSFFNEQLNWLNVIKISKPCKPDDMFFFDNPCYIHLNRIYLSLLEEAQSKNELITLNPAFTAHMLISAIAPESLIYYSKVLGYSIDQIADNFCSTFIEPLFKPQA